MDETNELIAIIQKEYDELGLLKLPSARKRVELLLGWSQQKINYLVINGRERKKADLEAALIAIRQAKKDTEADLERINEDLVHKSKIITTLQLLLNS